MSVLSSITTAIIKISETSLSKYEKELLKIGYKEDKTFYLQY
jgi:hypothetical protein